MKKLLLLSICLFVFCAIYAQNCNPPMNVATNAISSEKVRISWDAPSGTVTPSRLFLFNQADFVTHPGAGFEGADVSALYGGQGNYGPNANAASNFRLADDFTITAQANISQMEFFVYQTGAVIDTSTITGVYVAIYDVQPVDASSQPIWGDDVTNLLHSSEWSGVYRTTATALTNTERPIMKVVANINTILPAGDYWLTVSFTGTINSGPWAVPRSVLTEVSTGNGMQYVQADSSWTAWQDGTSLEQMGLPFTIKGFFVNDNLNGFNVYRDNQLVNQNLVESFYFVDDSLNYSTQYCYTVEAVYASCTSSHSSPVCITTPYDPCFISTFPYQESFDNCGTGTGTFPACWSKYNSGTSTTYPYAYATYYNSSPASLYMYSGSASYTMAISPEIDVYIPVNTLRCSFMVRKTSAAYNLIVGVMSNPDDPTTFVPIDTVSPSATTVWEPFEVSFAQYTGNGHYIAFRSGSGTGLNTVYLDDFVLEVIPSCDYPSNLIVSNTLADAVHFSWTPRGNESQWNLEYKLSDEEDWIQVYGLTSATYALMGLEAETEYSYDVRVQAVCSANEMSTWTSESFVFTTSCLPISLLPYSESFDDYGTGTSAFVPCWSRSDNYNTTSTDYPYINATNNTAPGSLYFYNSASSYSLGVTPMFSADVNTLQADFKLRKTSAAYKLIVGVMSNPNDLSTFVPVDTLSPSTTSVFEDFTVLFNTYTGNGHYIAFYSYTGATNGMYMDDLIISTIQTCFRPDEVYVDNVTQTTASFVWTPASDVANYQIEYKLSEDSIWTTVNNISDTTYTLTNLLPSTTYNFRLRTICNEGNYSYWTIEDAFTTLCNALTSLPYYDDFDSYNTATYPTCWSKSFSGTTTTTYPSLSATNYSAPKSLYLYSSAAYSVMAVTPELDASIGEINTLSLSFYARRTAVTALMVVGVISNPNDMSTFVPVDTIINSANAIFEPFEVSFASYQGTGRFIALLKPTNAVGGMYVDNFEINYSSSCLRPTNVTISNITANTADVSWSNTTFESSWTVEYKPRYEDTWTLLDVTNNSIALTSLLPNTPYDLRIMATCSSGEMSNYSFVETFNTGCGAISSFPYNESFDTYGTGTGTYPTCWSRYYSGTISSYPYINSINNSAPGSLYLYASSTYYVMAIMPQIDSTIPVNTLMLSFNLRKSSAAYNIIVGVMTDPTDPATFVAVDTVSPDALSTWEMFDLPLSSYTGNGQYIAFRSGSGEAVNTVYLDDVKLMLIPTCFRPTDIQFSQIVQTSTTVSWTPSGNEPMWTLAYKNDTADVWTEIANIFDSTYFLDNLSPNTIYQVKVKSQCGGSDESDYSEIETFQTKCDPLFTIPYTENFDSYNSGSANYPECWTRHTNYTSSYPYIYATYFVSPSRSLYFYSSPTTYSYIALPEIDASIPINTLQINFKARKASSAYYLEVGVMTDPDDYSTFVLIDRISPSAISIWEDFTVYFNTYQGIGQYIAFRCDKSAENLANGMYIDDVVVSESPDCILPTLLTASSIGAYSATIAWNSSASESIWEILYSTEGFNADTVSPVTITDNPFTLTNLSPNTTYDVYVRTLCVNGEVSAYSQKLSFTTRCAPILDLPYTEFFDTYGTGTTTYADCWTKNSSSTSHYISTTNFTAPGALYFSTTASTYSYAVTPAFVMNLNLLQLSFVMKAAMNVNYQLEVGVMSDPDDTSTFELIQLIEPFTAVWNGFTVPFTNYQGTAQHIAFRSQRNGSNIVYIDNLVIDYAPGCVTPLNLEVNNITTTTADLSWHQGRDESEWIVAYGPEGFNPNVSGTFIDTNVNMLTITGLTPASFYDFYIKSVCSATETSEWSMMGSFRTDCELLTTLPYIENFDTYGTGTGTFPTCWVRNTTYSTSTLYPYISTTNFSAPGSLYFASTATTYNVVTIPEFDPSIDISTLQVAFKLRKTSADYELKVGVMTNPNDISTFVGIDTVTPSATSVWEDFAINFDQYSGNGHFIVFISDRRTLGSNYMYLDNIRVDYIPSCIRPTHLNVSSITTTSAELSWTEEDVATSWIIEYGPVGFLPGSGTAVSTMTNPFTLTGLNNSTQYDFYVRSLCSASDTSSYSDVATFTTSCTPISVPYTENFDSYQGTTYNTQGIMPSCWSGFSNNTTYGLPHIIGSGSYWYTSTSPNSLVFTAGSAGNDAYAFLPEFNVPLNTLILTFWRQMENINNGVLSVGYITNTSDVSTFVSVATIPSLPVTGDTVSVDFTGNTIPQTGLIAFHWTYTSSFYSCCIDDISVVQTIVVTPCETPTGLSVSNVTDNEADIVWNINDNEQEWILAYKKETDQDFIEIVLDSNSYTLSNLEACTSYMIKVKSRCSDNNESEYSATQQFTTTGCAVNYYSIIATASVGGSITPEGELSIEEGGSQSFAITPDADNNYFILDVLVDNASVGVVSSYIFTNIVANHTIHAEFSDVGIDEFSENQNIALYPNPTHNVIELVINNISLNSNKVALYDVYGKLLKYVSVEQEKTTIDVQSFASGIYFIRIDTSNGIVTRKFVKE